MIDGIARQGGEVSVVTQLSRLGAVEAVERYIASILMALLPDVGSLEPELVHVARHGGESVQREVLRYFVERGERDGDVERRPS